MIAAQTPLTFLQPKDPDDVSWYILRSFEAVASVITVVPALIAPFNATIDNAPLIADNAQVNAKDTRLANGELVPATFGILFRLSFGKPGATYALRVKYVTLDMENVLSRNVFLNIAGSLLP